MRKAKGDRSKLQERTWNSAKRVDPEEESNGGCSGATKTESRETRSRRDREAIWRDEKDEKERGRELEKERARLFAYDRRERDEISRLGNDEDADDEGKLRNFSAVWRSEF